MPKYILFDTETTGIEEEDKIIQLGMMVVHSKIEIEVYDELCFSEKGIALEAMEVHNITPEKIASKPKFCQLESAKKIFELNKEENYLIAHNISFDLKMLKKEGFENHYTLIDTLRCAKHLLPQSPFHRLQYLRYSLGLYQKEEQEAKLLNITVKAHDAIGDVLVMKLLLSKLIDLTQKKYPNENPIKKLAYLTKIPVLLTTFRFGKYKGSLIEEMVKIDPNYIKWIQKNMELDEDMVFTLNHYLK